MHPHSPTTHAAGMAAKATTAPMAATTTASTSRKHWWRKSERRAKRARNEATEKPAVHRNSSMVYNCDGHRRNP
jgi:hypothetical protein